MRDGSTPRAQGPQLMQAHNLRSRYTHPPTRSGGVGGPALAAAVLLLATGAPALGILSALDCDANRAISRCAHAAPHSRTHPRAACWGPGEESRDFDGCWARAAPACLVAGAATRMGASARSGTSVHDAPPSGGVGEDLCSRGAFASRARSSALLLFRAAPHVSVLALAYTQHTGLTCAYTVSTALSADFHLHA